MAVVGTLLATASASLLLLTEFPSGLASEAEASTVLAELAARSPGSRIGGVALKSKKTRLKPASAKVASTARSVLPVSPPVSMARVGPAAGPIVAAPAGLAAIPSDVLSLGTVLPTPGTAPGVGFVPSPSPGGGGVIIGPGGGSGGAPGGGGGAIVPTPTPTPTFTPPVSVTPTPTPPPMSAVPEPATWLMLIVGFGAVGSALRKRRRVRFA